MALRRSRGPSGRPFPPWHVLLCVLVLGLGTLGLPVRPPPAWGAASSPAADAASADAMAQGLKAFQRGDFEHAVFSWLEAVKLAEKARQPTAHSAALTHLAQAYQALGHYREAITHLKAALVLAEQAADRAQIAAVLGSLGNVYSATGPAEQAEQLLRRALGLARELGQASLTAVIQNNLGNLFMSQHKPEAALAVYQDIVLAAQQAGHPAVAARALTNAAIATRQHGRYQASQALLHEAVAHMPSVEPSHDKAYGLITIGLAYDQLRPHLADAAASLLRAAFTAFHDAASVAQAIGNLRATSYAWGYLGRLYEAEQRHQEALQFTQRAVFAAQQVHAPESLSLWQWQTGRLLKALGHPDAAIAAYGRAVDLLQAMRHELPTDSGRPQASFREASGPVYFEFVDLLLQRAGSVPKRAQQEADLQQARHTVELFKAAELRDYFRDDCVDAARAKTRSLEAVSQTAAIVYPILLRDRLELLVSLPTGLKRFPVQEARQDAVERVVRSFREGLQEGTTRRYLRHAQRLYDWLIRPLEPDLTAFKIDTLVFVPDGALRTIPMAALHDGTQFLISKYALATTPGLDLTDPRPLPRDDLQVLAVGLTDSVQGFAPLPAVAQELRDIRGLYGGTVLLNQAFSLSSMEAALQRGHFDIVHIASHGHFAHDVEHSFLLTFDAKLTMDRLAQVVGPLQFRDKPLELLTLSACDTAIGDDRAALGLAGVAIKAGARSALATLWRVQDEAAATLVTEFYRHLHDAAVSRAVALQRAQGHLLTHPLYNHPFFWSPFLLLNSWS